MTTKVCTQCGVEKDISLFGIDNRSIRRGGDGFRSECKECDKQYRINNASKISEYLLKNKDKILKRDREYKIKNSKHISEYYPSHKKQIQIRHSEYNKSELGKISRARRKHRRRTNDEISQCNLTLEQWNKILKMQHNRCAVCHNKFTREMVATKDHIIPVSKGGGLTFENTQALCKSCNSKKRNKLDHSNIITWVGVSC